MPPNNKGRERSDLGIGKLSKRTGVNIETIRYYERIGMMPAPPRSAGGHRLYDDMHLKRLAFIRRSRELGFSIEEIRRLLGLVDGGEHSCGEVRDMALEHVAEIQRKIADLQRMEFILEDMASRCEGGTVPNCPILEELWA